MREERASARTDADPETETGGEPDGFGRCTECADVYPVVETDEGWHPIGTDGTCRCGNAVFTPLEAD